MSLRIRVQALLDRVTSALSDGTITTTDKIAFYDVDDSNTAKLATVAEIVAHAVGGSGGGIGFGLAFPSVPASNEAWVFTADVASGLTWLDTDGVTPLTSASKHDIAVYNGTSWVKTTDFSEYLTALTNLTTASPASTDELPFVDTSDSNANRKTTFDTAFDLQNATDTTWLTSNDFVDDDLLATGTLDWTAEAGAPTGAADGSNTQCTLPKSKDKPNNRINGIWIALRDGDSSDAIQALQFVPWLQTTPFMAWRLNADSDAYVDVVIDLAGADSITPTVTVTATQDGSNTLTGMYLTIAPAVIG